MIDTLLALFIIWILILVVGLLRRGIVWNFLELFIILVAYYEGLDLTLVLVMVVIWFMSLIYSVKGEEYESI